MFEGWSSGSCDEILEAAHSYKAHAPPSRSIAFLSMQLCRFQPTAAAAAGKSAYPSVSPASFSTLMNSSSSLYGTSGISCLKYSAMASSTCFSCTQRIRSGLPDSGHCWEGHCMHAKLVDEQVFNSPPRR